MKTARGILLLMMLCFLLTGCSLLTGGSHIFIEERQPPAATGGSESVFAADYEQLCDALVDMVEAGTAQRIISVEQYDKSKLEADLDRAVETVCAQDPIAAYAVKEIQCTVGTVNGVDSVSVQISYLRDQSQILQIISVEDTAQMNQEIRQVLNGCNSGLVLYVKNYEQVDFAGLVEEYARLNPDQVMERPQVTANIYPDFGTSRVVEVKFTYQTSRESLKSMQTRVAQVFYSAKLYVSGDAAQNQKFEQLSSFLMERFDYTYDTTVTPAYSLLCNGIGDAQAFANVYAAMCRQSELTCLPVSGTRSGESWYWNIVQIDDVYYHIDLLSDANEGVFRIYSDEQMLQMGYLWNFDDYPDCPHNPEGEEIETPPEETEENNEN